MNKNFFFAVSTLVGAIVGLGMFGIPYTVSRAGFFIGLGYLIVLGIVALLIHLMYGEVVERTRGRHRLTGYTAKYLGERWKYRGRDSFKHICSASCLYHCRGEVFGVAVCNAGEGICL